MKMKIVNFIFVCLTIFPVVANADTLLVTVNGVKAGEGNLRLAVFDEAHRGGFPDGKYLLGVVVPATGAQMTVEISDIDQGEYAVAIIQDLNENEVLDKNILGFPRNLTDSVANGNVGVHPMTKPCSIRVKSGLR